LHERGSYTPLLPMSHGGRMTDGGPAPPREPSYRPRLYFDCVNLIQGWKNLGF